MISYLRLIETLASLSLRRKDVLGPVTRVKKKKGRHQLIELRPVNGAVRRVVRLRVLLLYC